MAIQDADHWFLQRRQMALEQIGAPCIHALGTLRVDYRQRVVIERARLLYVEEEANGHHMTHSQYR